MAEGTYEHECMRAELLGIDKPNQEEFEKARDERLKQEQEEQEAAEATLLESQDEALKGTGGRLDELNSILTSTQQKLNRFKQTACGSFSNMFGRTSVDAGDGPSTSSSGAASRRNTTAGDGAGKEFKDTSDNPDEIEPNQNADVQPVIPIEKIRAAKLDLDKKLSSQLNNLDLIINKAENAEISMSEQTKQMKKMK